MSLPTAVLTQDAVRPAARRRVTPTPRPRLLLPPVPERDLRPEVTSAMAFVPPGLRSVRSPVTESPWPVLGPPRPQAQPAPSPASVCGPVVLAAVEALRGTRPLAQLVRWVSPQVYDALARRVDDGPRSGPVRRATIRSVRLCRVGEGIAEASVVVHDGTRVRAAAVRLELRRGQWRATVLQIG